MSKRRYVIERTAAEPDLTVAFDSEVWRNANVLTVDNFLPESSAHNPLVECKMLYDDKGLYGIFNVRDQYVRCVHSGYQSSVCRDSCVEFFAKPRLDGGYFNFEFNCGGAVLTSYIRDNSRTPGGFADFEYIRDEDMDKIDIFHTMPETVDPEITEPTEWRLAFHVPFEFFTPYCGEVEHSAGTEWEANFYKCADDTSHPHWTSWNPIHEKNYHLPEDFGIVVFG